MKSSEDFGQRVSAKGFTFVELPRADGLTEAALVDPRRFDHSGREKDIKAYNAKLWKDPEVKLDLRSKTALVFREFARIAEVADAQDAILAFANKYGFLGKFHVFPTPSYGDIKAEMEYTWTQEAGVMNRAIERHDLVLKCRNIDRDRDGGRYLEARDSLRRLYEGDERKKKRKEDVYSDRWVIRQEFANTPDLLRLCDEGDFEKAELAYVALLIDKKLKEYTSLKLVYDGEADKPTMQYRAHNLLGAMWLQFAEYVTEIRQYNFCRACGDPIVIMRTNQRGRRPRTDKDTCSGKCRTRASRAGKRSGRDAVSV